MQDAPSRPYHHGDLRRAVIETALDMLREEKGWQFTLREVARRAGVSHAAPYKHFSDKAALLAEIAMIGFDRLRESLSAAKSEAPKTLRDEITPIARAYVAFGTDNPALYRLMFSAEEGKAVGMPIEGQAAAGWGLIHGMTMLAIDGLLVPEKVGSAPLDAALSTLLEGLGNPAPQQ
ncbi:MAG: TetR/AcrR family transcriptional regulator [Mesorhizobium sp.]|nr:MAG: TetR/AcrR family transcriptional regulator [Mesorhizobium sp.]